MIQPDEQRQLPSVSLDVSFEGGGHHGLAANNLILSLLRVSAYSFNRENSTRDLLPVALVVRVVVVVSFCSNTLPLDRWCSY